MIYLTPDVDTFLWFSLRESVPVGSVGPFKFELQNDMSGEVKIFYPIDLQPDYAWSKFKIRVGTPENLPNVIDLRLGMWDYTISINSTILETGKILVEENKNWDKIQRPAKNIKVLKR